MATFTNVINDRMFGKIEPGMCRLNMSGEIAIKTSNGYKSYNPKKNRLTNCTNFVFDIGEEFFFLIPTNKVEVGDIILVGGKPRCVIGVEKDTIRVINYEDSTVESILPERHVFMGNTYFYGKIVSMFGSDLIKGKKGTNNIMKYIMMSEVMKGFGGNNGSGMSSILPFMMMGGSLGNMFKDMFDFGDDDEDPVEVIEEEDGEKDNEESK